MAAHVGAPLNFEASTNAREVLPGADFVVLSFAEKSVKYRGMDCAVALKYGVRMCSGDTIGPGGIMRTLRELPHIIGYCRDVRDLCPDAWVINYINPTAANGIGVRLFAPELKSFALCDGLHMPYVKRNYAKRAGIINDAAEWTPELDAKFDFRIAGPNHFTWLVKAEFDGVDVAPKIAESLRVAAAKETDGLDVGAKAAYNDTIDHATDIIENMWAGLGKPFFINTANGGSVPNMPEDAFLELMCDADMKEVRPRAVGDAPVGLRGLWQQVLDTHELTACAAVTHDRGLLYRAFACDPMVSSLADSRAMIDELLAAEKEVLPRQWFE